MKKNRAFLKYSDGRPLTAASHNILMIRIANAAMEGCDPNRNDIGDSIDRGLVVLRLLNEAGLNVSEDLTPLQNS